MTAALMMADGPSTLQFKGGTHTKQAPSIKVVDDFISAEFDWAEQAVKALPKREEKDLKVEADELFRKWVK